MIIESSLTNGRKAPLLYTWGAVRLEEGGVNGLTPAINATDGTIPYSNNPITSSNIIAGRTYNNNAAWALLGNGYMAFSGTVTFLSGSLYGNIRQLTTHPELSNIREASSTNFTLSFIKNDGTLWAFGSGTDGLIGNGATSTQYSPVQIGSNTNWSDIGSTHEIMYAWSGNDLYAWGRIKTGLFGYESNYGARSVSSPTLIGTFTKSNVKKTIATSYGAGVLLNNGDLYLRSSYPVGGFIGNVNPATREPATGVQLSNVTQLSIGRVHSAIIANGGLLYLSGANGSGQLGLSDLNIRYVHTQLGNDTWNRVTCGNDYTVGIRSNGTLWAWGKNNIGQLGNGTTTNTSSPVQIGAGTWSEVATGYYGEFAIAISSDGTLWSWGSNSFGQLGDGTTIGKSSPVQVSASTWSKVAASSRNAFAIRSDGKLFGWGDNARGTIGDGTTVSKSSPVQIGTENWSHISTGYNDSAGITTDGRLFVWGIGVDGATLNVNVPTQVGTATDWQYVVAIDDKQTFLAIKNDGTCYGWGDGGSGHIDHWGWWVGLNLSWNELAVAGDSGNRPRDVFKYTKVFATPNIAFGITTTGKAVVWANNTYNGEAGLGTEGGWTWTAQVVADRRLPNFTLVHSNVRDFTLGPYSYEDHLVVVFNNGTTKVSGLSYGNVPFGFDIYQPDATDVARYVSKNTIQYMDGLGEYAIREWLTDIAVGKSGTEIKNDWTGVDHANGAILFKDSSNTYISSWYNGAKSLTNASGFAEGTTPTTLIVSANRTVAPRLSSVLPGGVVSDNSIFKTAAGKYVSLSAPHLGVLGTGGIYDNFYNSDRYSQGPVYLWLDVAYLDSEVSRATIVPYDSGVVASKWQSFQKVGTSLYNGNIVQDLWLRDSGNKLFYANFSSGQNYPIGSLVASTIINNSPQRYINDDIYYQANAFSGKMMEVFPGEKIYKIAGLGGTYNNNCWFVIKDSDRRLYATGSGDYGLGLNVLAPGSGIRAIGTDTWKDISINCNKALAIRENGTLFAWGYNAYGQLGDGTTVSKSSPVQIGSSSDWAQVHSGWGVSYGVKTDGTLWTWGYPEYGPLVEPFGFTSVGNYFTVTSMAAGPYHFSAVWSDGTWYASGNQANFSTGVSNVTVPTLVASGSYVMVATSYNGTAAIASNGNLFVAGVGGGGSSQSPTVVGSDTWKHISGGSSTLFTGGEGTDRIWAGIKTNGTLWTWGNYTTGIISGTTPGADPNILAANARQIGTDTDWSTVVVGDRCGFAIKNNGTLWAWGVSDSENSLFGDNTGAFDTIKYLQYTGEYSINGIGATVVVTQAGQVYGWASNSPNEGYALTRILWNLEAPARVIAQQPFAENVQEIVMNYSGGAYYLWMLTTAGNLYVKTSPGLSVAGVTTGFSSPTLIDSGVSSIISDNLRSIVTPGIVWKTTSNVYKSWYFPNFSGSSFTGSPQIVTSEYSGYRKVQYTSNRHFLIKETDGYLYYAGSEMSTSGTGATSGSTTSPVLVASADHTKVQLISQGAITLRSDGSLWWWVGSGATPTQLSGTWVDIVGTPTINFGTYRGAAVRSDNTIWMLDFGSNTWVQMPRDACAGNIIKIFTQSYVGSDVSWNYVAVTDQNEVLYWGYLIPSSSYSYYNSSFPWYRFTDNGNLYNTSFRLLGKLRNQHYKTPVQIPGSWKMVSTPNQFKITSNGKTRVFGVKSDGTLWVWGLSPSESQGYVHGINTYSIKAVTSPTQIGTATDWESVHAVEYGGIAVKTNGDLYRWGISQDTQGVPILAGNNVNPLKIAHTTLGSQGYVRYWLTDKLGSRLLYAGNGYSYPTFSFNSFNLGSWSVPAQIQYSGVTNTGATFGSSLILSPVQVGTSTDWLNVKFSDATDNGVQYAIKSNGKAWMWGYAPDAPTLPIGDGTYVSGLWFPLKELTGSWKMISANRTSVLGLNAAGQLYMWGYNYNGIIGKSSAGFPLNSVVSNMTLINSDTDWRGVVNLNGLAIAFK